MPEDQNSPAPADEPKPEAPAPAAAPAAPKPEAPAPAPVAPAAAAKAIEPEEDDDMSDDDLSFGVEGAADTRNAENVYAAGDVVAYVAPLGTAAPIGFATLSSTVWGCLGWLDTAGGIFNLNHTTKDIGAAGTLSSIRTIFTGGNKTLQVTCLEALNPIPRALYDDVPVSTLQNSRVDAGCGTTSSSATVTDSSISAADVGSTVAGTGIPTSPVPTIVSVTPGTSFVMSASATATGTVSVTVSAPYSQYVIPEIPLDNRYALVLDSIDGINQVRMFAPMAKVTARGNDQIQQGDSENLQMTFTFFPENITIGSVTTRGSLARYINTGTIPEVFTYPGTSVEP